MRRDKQKELFVELINKQLEPHGKTYDDVVNEPDWFRKYKTTREKEKEFAQYAKERIMKELKLGAKQAENEVSWFILQWGLSIDPSDFNVNDIKLFDKSKQKIKIAK